MGSLYRTTTNISSVVPQSGAHIDLATTLVVVEKLFPIHP